MKVAIGMLAYNEEAGIAETLNHLREQDLWCTAETSCTLHVVVNGSTDRTVEVAGDALSGFPVPTEVHDVKRAGKANAWNCFVHELTPSDVDVFLLIDADILLPQPHALRAMIEALEHHPQAVASVDEPVKVMPGAPESGSRARLSQAASDLAAAGPPKLCGQLYAARASALREIFLPEPLLVEDGFIKAMLTTDAFRSEEIHGRLVRAPGVAHTYEGETSLGAWIRHEKRILLGTLCNLILFEQSRQWREEGKEPGDELRREMEADADWFRKRIATDLGRGGRHRRLGILLSVPWRQLRHRKGMAKVKALPAVLIRTGLTLLVMIGASRDLRQHRLDW